MTHRKHGYATALVAAACRRLFSDQDIALEIGGAETIILYADAANSTTNHIYPLIGFKFVDDALFGELRLL